MKKFFIQTFGCQMNKLDSELVSDLLEAQGMDPTFDPDEADVILFNTCSVREHAEDKLFSYLGRFNNTKEENPDLVIGVLGCTAERLGEEIVRRMPHVDFVCGAGRLALVPDLVRKKMEGNCFQGVEGDSITDVRAPRSGYVTAFVSAMRGCNCRCTYCVVPSVRGCERSRPPSEIISEINELVGSGVKEITLLGQSIDRYGRGLESECDLSELLRMVGRECSLERLRFVTSSPRGVSSRLLEAMAEVEPVCESIHTPAQSGSDRVLKAMGRRYLLDDYLDMVAGARKLVPDIELSSDFIVGFPGETEEDFEATARLMEEVRFLQSYIFKYSPRSGTRAADMSDDVPLETKAARNQRLLEIQNRISQEKHRALVESKVQVLAEGPSRKDPSRFAGRTRRNHIVIFEPCGTEPGQLVDVRIEGCTALSMYGAVSAVL